MAKMIGFLRHAIDHLLRHGALDRQAEENIGAFHRLGQRARFGLDRMRRLPLVHALGAALIDDALGVAHDDVVVRQPQRLEQFDAGDRRGARAVHHHLDVLSRGR